MESTGAKKDAEAGRVVRRQNRLSLTPPSRGQQGDVGARELHSPISGQDSMATLASVSGKLCLLSDLPSPRGEDFSDHVSLASCPGGHV